PIPVGRTPAFAARRCVATGPGSPRCRVPRVCLLPPALYARSHDRRCLPWMRLEAPGYPVLRPREAPMTATYTTDLAKVAPYKRIVIRNIVHICALFILIAMVAGARGNFSPPGLISMAVGGLVGALARWLMTWSALRTL